ncbi:two-partner secretion domain-containing protein [Pasteurella canis]|uniref:two-partner secretion domain-containing protein n=1 Tax=Pasteurella canis TaxID=753 RepID=UPI00132C7FC1|nr:DUF637 domain-containing protein [Pasteurella canis]MXN88845.1 filamentous hemagglutinin N-terminal domain-containing protein [Pasteurella canis]
MSKLNHTGNKNVQKRKPQCYVRKKSQLNCSFSHQLKTTCLITSFLFQSIAPSYANIIADNQAPQNQQPIILKDGQGNPLINIQTPNANGLSHNRYTQFDVDTHGATLNNHRTSNPHLAKGTAKVILNEVRSNSPSKLEGIVSVIGDKADVIIANPSGIQVNGGGFKNVGRSTLTTGQIEAQNGVVKAIDVQQGTISIGSKGFDNRETDYTEILARAVEVQGVLQANQVGISTGNQKVDYTSSQVLEKRDGTSTSEVAIDIAELGGIYANSIHLIANENGVGVKNSGQLKANNRLVVTSSGRIENAGEMLAQHNSDKSILVLETVGENQDILSTKGKIEGKDQVILSASGKVKLANTKVQQTDKNAGTGVLVNSKDNIEITESQLTSAKGNVSLLSKNDIYLANNTLVSTDNDLFLRSQDGKIRLDTLFETKTETHNDSIIEHPVLLNAKGEIKFFAPKIEINAAKLKAENDISLITNKDSLFINGVSSRFNDYKTNKHNLDYLSQLEIISHKIDSIINTHEYQTTKKRVEWLRRKAYGFWNKESRDLQRELQREYRTLKARLQYLDSLVKEEKKQKAELEKILSVLNQNGRGHEYTLTELTGKNINIFSEQGISIEGAKLNADQMVNIHAIGLLPQQENSPLTSININGVFDSYEYGGGNHYAYGIFNNPTVINGKTGVNISTTAQNGMLTIGASHISSDEGKINLQAYQNIDLTSGQGELYTYDKHSYKTGKWYKRKYVTEIKEYRHAKADPTILTAAKGIDIQAGGNLNAYATLFDAPKGTIDITVGQEINLYAVDEIHYNKLESHKRSKFLGIRYNKSDRSSTQSMKTALPSRLVAQSTNLTSGWDTLLQGTQFENTLTGANIRVGVGEKARENAKLILKGIKTTIQNEETYESSSLVWQKMAGKGELVESLILPSFKGEKPIFDAPNGIIADIPEGDLKTELEKLIQKPEYAYLKALKSDENVDWNQVALAYNKWEYEHEGLTGAAAALIAISVAIVTSGAGTAGAGAALIGAGKGTLSAAMANAAVASLTSQAAIAIVNNKGDVGHALKDLGRSHTVKNLATSVVTAGVAHQVLGAVGLAEITEASQFSDRLTESLINAGTSAVVHTAINGGSLSDSLESSIIAALVQTLHGELAQHIKGITVGNEQVWYRQVAHKLAHAVTGCAAASAQKGRCSDGAMGAAVGEIVAEILGNQILKANGASELTFDEKRSILNKTKLIVGSIAALTNADVNMTVDTATIAVKNNYLTSEKEREKQRLIYESGKRKLSDEEQRRLFVLAIEDLESSNRLIAACENVSSEACSIERSKAFSALKSYIPLTIYHPREHQPGYVEITDLLSYTDADSVALRNIYNGYIESFKAFGFSDEQAKKAASRKLNVEYLAAFALNMGKAKNNSQALTKININKIYLPSQQKLHELRVESLAHQINKPDFKHKNLVLTMDGKVFTPIQDISRNASVYQGLNTTQIFELTKQIAGVDKLPDVRIMPNKTSISGDQGMLYVIQPTEGKWKGASINLRNYSNSDTESKARWTIDINIKKQDDSVKLWRMDKFELKFQ